jgi:dihydroflavonol-4-reductase
MRAFVTGSTGLLGSNLVRQLVEAGVSVRALARSSGRAADIFAGLGVEVVEGDMGDVEAFAPRLAGCDVLFHAAAYFRESFQPGDHWPVLERINVRGTVRLLEAAERAGVHRAIYVSSSGVIGPHPAGRAADESSVPGKQSFDNLYFRSKVQAEEAVYRFLDTHRLPVVLVLPGWMFGPGDYGPTESGALVRDFLHRRLPGVLQIPGTVSIVDARDVAAAMVRAVEAGRSGERYILSGESYSLNDVVAELARVSGIAAPTLPIPYGVALALARVSETFARLTGGRSLLTTSGLATLADSVRLDSSKAARALGFRARPLPETLRDEVAWFRNAGLAPALAR